VNLSRTTSSDRGTFGVLTGDAGERLGVTVERPPTGDHPCIPAGTYDWVKFTSPHNGDCLLLKDVPGRDMIEMHSANYCTQLLGCIAPGSALAYFPEVGLQGVINSKATLAKILGILPNSGSITITDDFS